jgi:hypothetical protein
MAHKAKIYEKGFKCQGVILVPIYDFENSKQIFRCFIPLEINWLDDLALSIQETLDIDFNFRI